MPLRRLEAHRGQEMGQAAALAQLHLDVEVPALLPRPVLGDQVRVRRQRRHRRYLRCGDSNSSLPHAGWLEHLLSNMLQLASHMVHKSCTTDGHTIEHMLKRS